MHKNTIYALPNRTTIYYLVFPAIAFLVAFGISFQFGPYRTFYHLSILGVVPAVLTAYLILRDMHKNPSKSFFERYSAGNGVTEYHRREIAVLFYTYVVGITLITRPILVYTFPSDIINGLIYSEGFQLLITVSAFVASYSALVTAARTFWLRSHDQFNYYYSMAHLELAAKENDATRKASHFRSALIAYNAYLKREFHVRIRDAEKLSVIFRLKDSSYKTKILTDFLGSLRTELQSEAFGLGALELLSRESSTMREIDVLESYSMISENSILNIMITKIMPIMLTIIGLSLQFGDMLSRG